MLAVGIFLIFWGFMFGGMPLITLLSSEEPLYEILPFLSVFVIIGVCAILFGVYTVAKNIRILIVKKRGIESIGRYVTSDTSISRNHVPYFFIVFRYKTENGEEKEFKTDSIYNAEQLLYYKKLGTFQIKYMGNTATITEKINYEKLAQLKRDHNATAENLQTSPFASNFGEDDEFSKRPEPIVYYTCDYCGGTNTAPGRCPNCGARLKRKEK